jgi:hypothetical protein
LTLGSLRSSGLRVSLHCGSLRGSGLRGSNLGRSLVRAS